MSFVSENLLNFIQKREEAIKLLKEIVNKLNKSNRLGNIARIVSGGVGIVAAIVGAAAVPFTGGLSLGLVIGGVTLGAGGTVTGIGATVGVVIKEKCLLKKAEAILTDDKKAAEKLQLSIKKLKISPESLVRFGMKSVLGAGQAATSVVKGVTKVAPRLLVSSERAGSTVAHVARVGSVAKVTGAALGVLFIPLFIWDIVYNAKQLGKQCKKADVLLKTITELAKDLGEKKTEYNRLF